ncbi:hypothetical protein KCU64_g13057, partial [Aureobasidium melanogenum]
MIPVLFALAMVFQGKLFKPIRKQKESQAAVDAELREEHERKELDTGRAIQEDVYRERAVWEERYRESEKKKPDVEQRQVYPPPPSKTGHKLHNAASFILDKFKPDTRNSATTKDREQHPDEIRPVETSIESTEAATNDSQTRRPQSPRRYPSLRPTSCPPPPIVPQTDYECDTSSDGRVSSLELALDMEDHARHVVPDQDAAEIESSIQLSNQHENEENSLATIKLSQPNLSNCEQHTTQQPFEEGETNEQHQPPPDKEDTNEPLQYAHLEPKKLDLGEVLNDHESSAYVSAFAAVNRDEIMNRTREWRKTVVQTELNSRPSSTYSYDANNEPSAWSEFEGIHTTDNTYQRLGGQETAGPQPLQHDLSRGSAIEKNKRRSRRVSVIEGKTAILPAPVKSARVKKRNSSLPMLNTGSTLLEDRTTIAQHRKKQVSLTNNFLGNETQGEVARRNFGSHGKFTDGNYNNVESTDLDEITLSQARAALHARSVSNSQVSTISSHPPRASSSVGCQSPATTTARTTPTASSPVNNCPPFMMVAYPLRNPYPIPPCETIQPIAPPYRYSSGISNPDGKFTSSGVKNPATAIQNNDSWTPRTPRRSSAPVPFPAAQPTLIHRMGFDENKNKQTGETLRNTQRRGTADAAENRQRSEARRRRNLEAEHMMRHGYLDIAHAEAMRKIQREANKNCQ